MTLATLTTLTALLALTAPPVTWLRTFSSSAPTGTVAANAVRANGGRVTVGGSFHVRTDFGCGAMQARGGPDGFVGSFNGVNGLCRWSAQIGGPGAQAAVTSVAIDPTGDVYAAGWFTSTVTLATATLHTAGGTDGFLAKYDGGTGALEWAIRMGGGGQDKVYAVTDGPIVTGYFTNTASFGGPLLTSAGNTDIFVAKYAADSTPVWSKRIGSLGADIGTGLASVNGGFVLTGTFSGGVNFGARTALSAGGTDVFVAGYDNGGGPAWTTTAGGIADDTANAVDTDANGNAVVTGTFIGAIDFGGGPLIGATAPSIFLAKLSPIGVQVWAHGYRSPSLALFGGRGRAVAVSADTIALTGSITDDIDFGGGALVAPYTADFFLATFSTDGVHRWSARYSPFRDEGEGVAFGPGLVAAGVFATSIDFGGGPILGR